MTMVWHARAEEPEIICAAGKSEAKVLKRLGKTIEMWKEQDFYVIGINTHYDDDGTFLVEATLSRA